MATQAVGRTPPMNRVNPAVIGTEYEVKCHQTFAYYTGYIVDWLQDKQKFVVAYDKDWKPQQEVDPADIRPPLQPLAEEWAPSEGDRAEAMAKAEENEPFGWWPVSIRCIKGEFFLINFEGWDDSHNEIIAKEKLRIYNTAKPLKRKDLSKEYVDVPEALRKWAEQVPLAQDLREMAQTCNLIHIAYDKSKKGVMLIGDKRARKRAKLLIGEIFNHKKTIMSLESEITGVQSQIAEEREKLDGAFKEEFEVKSKLVRYVIGRKGENIQKAEKIKGVARVTISEEQPSESSDSDVARITILAENEDIAKEARDILEIVEDRVEIPPGGRIMSRIIGKGGSNIKDIIKKSEVILIRSLQRQDRSEEDQGGPEKLIIIGTVESVSMGKMIIQQQIKNFSEFDKMESTRNELTNDLQQLRPRGFGGPRDGRDRRDRRNDGGVPGDTEPRQGGRGRGRRRNDRDNKQRSNRDSNRGGGDGGKQGGGGGGRNRRRGQGNKDKSKSKEHEL